MTKEELLEVIQFKDLEDRTKIKEYFTSPNDLDLNKKTIVFSTPSETGTSYFRIFEPMRALWKSFPDEANYLYTENIQPNHIKIADVIIMHRCGNLHSHFLSVARMWPKTEKRPYIIHDADDNEFNLPNSHPMKTLWIESGKDKMSLQSIKHSDCITTTTPKLAKTFGNFNDNVNIFPNQFDWDLPQWNYDKNEVRKEMWGDWFPTDDKIIIWSTYVYTINKIAEALVNKYGKKSVVTFYGEVSVKDRHKRVEDFQNDKEVRFFVANPSTGGIGLTLTAANTVIYYCNNFNLEQRVQSEDRAHRKGQKNVVNYIDLITENTIDKYILHALKRKLEISAKTLGEYILDFN